MDIFPRRPLAALALAWLTLAIAAASAPGADYTVSNTAGSGAGSLDQAVADLNAGGGGSNTITLAIPGGTIALGSALSALANSVSILNNSGGTVTITTPDGSKVFASDVTLTLGGANPLVLKSTAPGSSFAYGLGSDSSNLNIGSLGSQVSISAQTGRNSAFGVYTDDDLRLTGDMAATISATASGRLATGMIASNGALRIDGALSGKVTATVSGTDNAYGLYSFDTLRLGSVAGAASVTASAATKNAYGLDSATDLTIDGDMAGTVSATAGTSKAYAISAESGDLSVGGAVSGSVTAKATAGAGAYAISALDPSCAGCGNMSLGSVGAAGRVLAQTGTNGAYGLYSDGNLSVTGAMAGTVTAIAGTHTAVGIQSLGTLNGGAADKELTISGTVTAQASGLAVAVASAGAMNLRVTGTLAGTDTSGSGAGYAIRAGKPDGAGGWIASSADNTVTLDTGATVTGKVDLGGGTNTLNLYGGGATGAQFIGVSNLVVGSGGMADWTLNPDASHASTFGNLAINANASLSINENVTILGNTRNDGRLTFDIATSKAYAGVISGLGSVTKAGPGILYLGGDNTYLGGTFINAGTLCVTKDASLGDPSGALTLGGGRLLAGAPFATTRIVVVGTGGGGLDNGGFNLGIGGAVTGSGALAFGGAGTTTVSGDGSGYSGRATVTGGTLVLAPGAALGGTLISSPGTVVSGYGTLANFVNGGIVSPGGSIGTLAVSGDYTQSAGAVFYDEVAPNGRGDLIMVGGRARIEGGILFVSAPVAFYPTGTAWRTIAAAKGASGSFSGALSDFPSYIVNFQPVATQDGIATQVCRNPYAAFAANPRAAAAGAGLNRGAYAAYGTFADAILTLDMASPSAIAIALDHLHPEPYDAFTQTGFDTGRQMSALVLSRLGGLRGEAGPSAFAGPFDAGPGRAMDQAMGPSTVESGGGPGRVGIFARTFGLAARQGGSGGRTPYANQAAGGVGGLDWSAPGGGLAAGIFAGYAGRDLVLGGAADGFGRADTASLGLFASRFGQNWFIEGAVRLGLDASVATRTVAVPSGAMKVNSAWNGWNMFASLGGGCDFMLGPIKLGPAGGIEFARLAQDGYTEYGAGPLGLYVRARADLSLHTALGVRATLPLESSLGIVIPEVRLLWGHEWIGGGRDIAANFRGFSSASFTTQADAPATDWLDASVGLGLRLGRATLTARVSADLLRRDYRSVAGSLSLSVEFYRLTPGVIPPVAFAAPSV